MDMVINELSEMLYSCELDGESDGEFAEQLRKAIDLLKKAE
jgi:hypothetical protein